MMYLYALMVVSLGTVAGNIGSHLLMLWYSRREWRRLEDKATREVKQTVQMFADMQRQVDQRRRGAN